MACTGIGMIRGWAVSSDAIERVEVFVDGEYLYDIPHGGNAEMLATSLEIPNQISPAMPQRLISVDWKKVIMTWSSG